MARKRMVTRTVEQTTAQVMTLDVTTAEVQVRTYDIGGKYTDEELLKKLQKLFQTDTLKFVHIESQSCKEVLLGMDEEEFINELREIEDRLFLIRGKIGTSLHDKLDYIWAELYDYLEEVEDNDE